jgi:hypothetical protein
MQPGFLHSAPAHSGRTVEIFLQGHVLNLGGKKEREIETEVETDFCENMARNEEYVSTSREIGCKVMDI